MVIVVVNWMAVDVYFGAIFVHVYRTHITHVKLLDLDCGGVGEFETK